MKRRWLLACAAVLLLSACTLPQIHYDQLSALDRGMPPDRVAALLKQPPLSAHAVVAGNRSFEFHRYFMNNGLQTSIYLLAYENNRLLYWGHVSEFRRLQESDLNAALTQALPGITAAAQAQR